MTVGDSTYPRLERLEKVLTKIQRIIKNDFSIKIYARVVSENSHGMLKGRWRFICKEYEAKEHYMKYVIMAAVLLHNICIHILKKYF